MDFDLQKYKSILNQTMKAFMSFCEEHEITYYASGGTALGAVRHKGIIPWDDDIDVYMKRSDYERFLTLRSKLNDTEYGLLSVLEGSYYLPFGKFYHKGSTIWELKECECLFGVYIDIFVLDEIQQDSSECIEVGILYREYFEKWRRSLNKHSLEDFLMALSRRDRRSIKFICGTWCRTLLRQYYKYRTVKLLDRIKKFKGDRLYTYGIDSSSLNLMYPKEWFSHIQKMDFEDYKINVHSGVRDYLASQYGDYMQLPKVEDRVSLHVKYYINLDEGLDIREVKRIMREMNVE